MTVRMSLMSPSADDAPEAVGARIYDFAQARARRDATRADAIPSDVWAEIEAANRLFEELEASGRRIVLDDERLDGRLVIELCDLEGRMLRAVPPTDLVAGDVFGAPRDDGQEGAA
jgi:hypothetical protein